MLTELTLAAIAGLLPQVEAVKQPPTAPPRKLNTILSNIEVQAIALAAKPAVNLARAGGLT